MILTDKQNAGNGERNQARQRATKQTAEPRAVKARSSTCPACFSIKFLPFRFLTEQAASMWAYPCCNDKGSKIS